MSSENIQHQYNTRNRGIPNIGRHSSTLYNKSFLNKSYTHWVTLNNTIKTADNEYKLNKLYFV